MISLSSINSTLRRRQSGLSLIELMVSIVVGSLLVIAAIYMFLSSKRTYTQAERLVRMSENARYALGVLSEDLRHVDFWGNVTATDVQRSGTLNKIGNDCDDDASGYDLKASLWSVEATSSSVIGCIQDAIPGSNVVVVKHVAQEPTAAGALKTVSNYVLSNSVKAILFNDFKNPPSSGPGGDVPDGQYWEYKATVYYVRDNEDGVPSLYRLRLQNGQWSAPQEVAVGIERMRVEFGIDDNDDGSAEAYVRAPVSDWDKVVAARIYLLVRSEQEDGDYVDNRSYVLGDGETIAATKDRYHRMVLNTTVSLRNRRLVISEGQL